MPRPFLYVEDIAKTHPGHVVFEHLTFGVQRSELVCLVGHSGCGKSTVLNIIAGLDQASSGYVFVDGRPVLRPGLDRGVIFQNHSLLPWKSALANVAFSVRARWPGWTRRQVLLRSHDFLERVGLHGAEHRRPAQLSGGMRQRVGIARAFAVEPAVMLMDEPFGALDALSRGNMQDELLRIWGATQQTVFMITHDVDEAIYLADRILLMTRGPNATIGASVNVDVPRPRDRRTIVHHPRYYAIRNRLVEFLVDEAGGSES